MARYNELERGFCVLSLPKGTDPRGRGVAWRITCVQNTSRCDLRAGVRSRGHCHHASHELSRQTRSYPWRFHQPFCYRIRHRGNPTTVARLGRGTPHRHTSQLARCDHYEGCCPHPRPGSGGRPHHRVCRWEIWPMIQTNLKPGPTRLRELSPLECTVTENASASPLESALTKTLDLKPFRILTYEKRWVGGGGTGGRSGPVNGDRNKLPRRGRNR